MDKNERVTCFEHIIFYYFIFYLFQYLGNEPWNYDASFYVQVLEGMAKGLRDGDPKIKIAPGAFQADTPDIPPQGDGVSWNNKYAGIFYYIFFSLC